MMKSPMRPKKVISVAPSGKSRVPPRGAAQAGTSCPKEVGLRGARSKERSVRHTSERDLYEEARRVSAQENVLLQEFPPEPGAACTMAAVWIPQAILSKEGIELAKAKLATIEPSYVRASRVQN